MRSETPVQRDTAVQGPPRQRGGMMMALSIFFFIANALMIRLIGSEFGVNAWLTSTFRFVVGLAVVGFFFGPAFSRTPRATRGAVRESSVDRRASFQPAQLVLNPLLVLRGLLGGAAVYCFYLTLVELGAGRATFINNLYVLFGSFFAMLLLGERLDRRALLGLGLGLFGMLLLTGAVGTGGAFGRYDLVAVAGAIFAGGVVTSIRKLQETEHPSTIFAAQCVYGLLFCLVPAVASWEHPGWIALGLLVLTGVFAAVGQITMTYAYRVFSVARGGLLQMTVPIGIGIGGVIFFSEAYRVSEAAGAVLIIVSCLVALRGR